MSGIADIPVEILAIIREEFGISEYLACGRVSKAWRRLFTAPDARKELLKLYNTYGDSAEDYGVYKGEEVTSTKLVNAHHQGRPLKWSRFERRGTDIPILRGHRLLHGCELLDLMTHESVKYDLPGLPAFSNKLICFAGEILQWAYHGGEFSSIPLAGEVLAVDVSDFSIVVLTKGDPCALTTYRIDWGTTEVHQSFPWQQDCLYALNVPMGRSYSKVVLPRPEGYKHKVTLQRFGCMFYNYFSRSEEKGEGLAILTTGWDGEVALHSGHTQIVRDDYTSMVGHIAVWKERLYRRTDVIESMPRRAPSQAGLILTPARSGALLVNQRFLVDYGEEIYVYAFDPDAKGQELKTGDTSVSEPVFKWPASESKLWSGEVEEEAQCYDEPPKDGTYLSDPELESEEEDYYSDEEEDYYSDEEEDHYSDEEEDSEEDGNGEQDEDDQEDDPEEDG